MNDLSLPAVLLVICAPAIGAFLGVLIDRLPRGEDWVARPSACRSCGARLRLRDLIPVVSFAGSRGRCRHCGAAIPPWLLYVEIAATGLALWALVLGQGVGEAWAIAAFLWLLLGLIVTDLRVMRLPDLMTGALLGVALVLAVLTGWPPLAQAALGAVLGAGSFALLRWGYAALRGREGLGLGDVKLMAGLGAALGPYDLPLMVLMAALATLAAALAGAVTARAPLAATRALPFGAALAGAGGVLWCLRHLPV